MNETERLLAIIERQQFLIEQMTTALISRDGGVALGPIDSASWQQGRALPGHGRVPWNKARTELERMYSKKYAEVGVRNEVKENASEIREAVRPNADGREQPVFGSDGESAESDGGEGVYIQDSSGEEEEILEESDKK